MILEDRSRVPVLQLFGPEETNSGFIATNYYAYRKISKGTKLFYGGKTFLLSRVVKAGRKTPAVDAVLTGKAQKVIPIHLEEAR